MSRKRLAKTLAAERRVHQLLRDNKLPTTETAHTCPEGTRITGRVVRTCLACWPLAGVDELRAVVRWANAVAESQHEDMTAEQILVRYRELRDSE